MRFFSFTNCVSTQLPVDPQSISASRRKLLWSLIVLAVSCMSSWFFPFFPLMYCFGVARDCKACTTSSSVRLRSLVTKVSSISLIFHGCDQAMRISIAIPGLSSNLWATHWAIPIFPFSPLNLPWACDSSSNFKWIGISDNTLGMHICESVRLWTNLCGLISSPSKNP